MELELQTGSCTNCTGLDKCNKVCLLHSGKALVDFIKRIDVVETRIGEYSSKDKGGKQDLVVYGHQIYDMDTPSWLLTNIDTMLDVTDKFMKVFNKNAIQISTMYCKHIGMTAEETKEITDKIKGINKNKLLAIPFKPGTSCNVDVAIDDSTEKKKDATIKYIKWITNKETHKLNCTIGFNLLNVTSTQTVKINMCDYIDKFRLNQMELKAKGAKHDKSLIKVTDYGIFKPIVIKDKKTIIAIDGTYLYYEANDETHIIGYWNDRNELVVDSKIKSKAVDKIKDNIDYIKNHKKYMAPYMMYEPNIIELK